MDTLNKVVAVLIGLIIAGLLVSECTSQSPIYGSTAAYVTEAARLRVGRHARLAPSGSSTVRLNSVQDQPVGPISDRLRHQ